MTTTNAVGTTMLPPSAQFTADSINASPVGRAVMQQAAMAEQRRRTRMQRAQDAFYGRLPETLRTKPGKPNDNIKLNYGRRFVNRSASFLFGKGIEFEIDATRSTEEEELLTKVWKRNRKKRLLADLAVNGAIYGHVFARLLPPDATSGSDLPRIIALDPMTVTVDWAPDDIAMVTNYTISYPTISLAGKPITYRTRITPNGGAWLITDATTPVDRDQWVTLTETVWPYPFPPIVHCQNLPAPSEFWGMADLEDDVVDLIQAVNFSISMVRRVVRYHGHPKTIVYGLNAKQLQLDTDEMLILQNPDTRIENLTLPADLGLNMQFFGMLRSELHNEAQVPEIALGNMAGVGALSGVALRIMYQPMLDRNEAKQESYGELLEQICERLLVMAGLRDSVDDVEVTCSWPEALPRDEEREIASLGADMQLGIVAPSTIATKRGYDYPAEMVKKARDAKLDTTAEQPEAPQADTADAQEVAPTDNESETPDAQPEVDGETA